MMYVVKVRYYNEFANTDDHMTTVNCFVPAEDRYSVIQKMENFYGARDIEAIIIEDFSPDDFLAFDNHDMDLFYQVKNTLAADVIW